MSTELDPELAALDGETLTVLSPGGLTVVVEALDDDAYGYPRTANLKRGQSIVLTEPILRASRDRNGRNSWLLEDEDLQVLRYGHVRFSLDGWPEGESVLVKDSPEAVEQGDRERERAWRTLVGPELVQTLKDIDERLGRGGWKSTNVREDRRKDQQVAADALEQRRLVQAELDRQNRAAVVGQHAIVSPDGAA